MICLKTLYLSLAVCLLLCACHKTNSAAPEKPAGADEQRSIRIIKKAPVLSRKNIGRLTGDSPPLKERAYTRWFFHCYSNFHFDIVQENRTAGKFTVSIVITGVTITIALPITLRLSEPIKQDTLDHEYGHVRICRQVYDHAEDAARKAAEAVMGARFTGTGDTRESAVAQALVQSAQAVGKTYTKQTAEMQQTPSRKFTMTCRGTQPIKPMQAQQ